VPRVRLVLNNKIFSHSVIVLDLKTVSVVVYQK